VSRSVEKVCDAAFAFIKFGQLRLTAKMLFEKRLRVEQMTNFSPGFGVISFGQKGFLNG